MEYLKIIKILFSIPTTNKIDVRPVDIQVTSRNLFNEEWSEYSAENVGLQQFYKLRAEWENKIILGLSPEILLINNVHSLLIGILTIFIIIFIFNPELLLNGIAIIVAFLIKI